MIYQLPLLACCDMANNNLQSYAFLEQGPWIGAALLWHHQCADCLIWDIWDIWDIWSASPAVHWKKWRLATSSVTANGGFLKP